MKTSNPEAKAAIEKFANSLRREHRNIGEPSLRAMAIRMSSDKGRRTYPTSSSTLHRLLHGEYLPPWDLVEAFLQEVLGVPDELIQSEWRVEWIKIRDLEDPIP